MDFTPPKKEKKESIITQWIKKKMNEAPKAPKFKPKTYIFIRQGKEGLITSVDIKALHELDGPTKKQLNALLQETQAELVK